jgi:hypothetical protein
MLGGQSETLSVIDVENLEGLRQTSSDEEMLAIGQESRPYPFRSSDLPVEIYFPKALPFLINPIALLANLSPRIRYPSLV